VHFWLSIVTFCTNPPVRPAGSAVMVAAFEVGALVCAGCYRYSETSFSDAVSEPAGSLVIHTR
jgi:hypothetical protein